MPQGAARYGDYRGLSSYPRPISRRIDVKVNEAQNDQAKIPDAASASCRRDLRGCGSHRGEDISGLLTTAADGCTDVCCAGVRQGPWAPGIGLLSDPERDSIACRNYAARDETRKRPRGSSHYPVCPKPAITLSRNDWHSSANGAVV